MTHSLDTALPARLGAPIATAAAMGAALLVSACYPPPPDASVAVDEAAILSALRTYQASAKFERLNLAAYATSLASGALINVYVSGDDRTTYAAVTPETEGSGVTLTEGTLIVREVLGSGGASSTLTLMYKGAAGYNPDLGDYWFGVTDVDGEPLVVDGQPRLGRLADCYGCHLDRPDDDFLFGVPSVHRP